MEEYLLRGKATNMKVPVVPLLAVVLVGAVVYPAFNQVKVISKRPSPEYVAREEAQRVRVVSALASLRSGDESRKAEVRSVIASLRPGDLSRPMFAGLLADRGEVLAAFEVERTRARFMEASAPDDEEMALYARIAEKAGHPEEAAWARERMGPEAHFRIWKLGKARMFSRSRAILANEPGAYEAEVNHTMDHGLELHPKFREEIETLRDELLHGR